MLYIYLFIYFAYCDKLWHKFLPLLKFNFSFHMLYIFVMMITQVAYFSLCHKLLAPTKKWVKKKFPILVQGKNQACSKWFTQVTEAENFFSTNNVIEENKQNLMRTPK